MHSIYIISILLQTWTLYSDSICQIAGFATVSIFFLNTDLCVRNIKSSPHIQRDSLTPSSGGSIKLNYFISFYKEHFFLSLQKNNFIALLRIYLFYISILTYYIVSRTFHLCYLRFLSVRFLVIISLVGFTFLGNVQAAVDDS